MIWILIWSVSITSDLSYTCIREVASSYLRLSTRYPGFPRLSWWILRHLKTDRGRFPSNRYLLIIFDHLSRSLISVCVESSALSKCCYAVPHNDRYTHFIEIDFYFILQKLIELLAFLDYACRLSFLHYVLYYLNSWTWLYSVIMLLQRLCIVTSVNFYRTTRRSVPYATPRESEISLRQFQSVSWSSSLA
jgi:hypothetical protein